MNANKKNARKPANPPIRTFEVTIAETRYSIVKVKAPSARAAKLEAAEIFLCGEPDSAFTTPYTMRITAQS